MFYMRGYYFQSQPAVQAHKSHRTCGLQDCIIDVEKEEAKEGEKAAMIKLILTHYEVYYIIVTNSRADQSRLPCRCTFAHDA